MGSQASHSEQLCASRQVLLVLNQKPVIGTLAMTPASSLTSTRGQLLRKQSDVQEGPVKCQKLGEHGGPLCSCLYVTHSSSLSKSDTYITHNATPQLRFCGRLCVELVAEMNGFVSTHFCEGGTTAARGV